MFDIKMLFDNYRYKVVLIKIKSMKMSIDEKIINIKKEDLNNLYKILRYIDKKSNSNSNVIDPVIYNISIYDEEYSGDSNSNRNFYMLNDWIGEINDRK